MATTNRVSGDEFEALLTALDNRVMEKGESPEAAAEAVTGGNLELDAELVRVYQGGKR